MEIYMLKLNGEIVHYYLIFYFLGVTILLLMSLEKK